MNLDALPDLIGDARVVAIGESAHHVPDYQRLRHRLLRLLVERTGFTVFALESGFSEGLAVDAWIHGGPGELSEVAERGLTYSFGRSREMRDQLAWMRAVNDSGGDLSYTGLDLPGGLASMLPALDGLGGYLPGVDPEGTALLAAIRSEAEKYAGPHTMPAFAAYQAMDPADRDRLTVLLAELAARFDTLRPFYVRQDGPGHYATARHELRLAVLLDQALRAQSAGRAAVNVRDAALAETASWLLGRGTSRIVIGAANSHLQRVPLTAGSLRLPVLGQFLADALGDDYVAIALTSASGQTVTRRAAPDAPGGVETAVVELGPPAEGSVEAAYGPGVTDLRPLRGAAGAAAPSRIRLLDTYAEVPVLDAFDAVVCLPVTLGG